MNRLIISGAGGFLGRNIIKAASEKHIPVVAITTRADAVSGETVSVLATDRFFSEGIRLNADDVFINCLFPTNADGVKMANGLKAVCKTISAARKSGVGAFINISSQSVYPSDRERPAAETDPLSLETPYAVGKYGTEEYTNLAFCGVPHTNIRMASLLGVGYDQRIVNRMTDFALKGNTLKVVGGMQRYGFLDVRDAADGLLKLALSDPAEWREVYNLGRQGSCTLIDVAECIVSEMKRTAGIDVRYEITEGRDDRNSSIDPSCFEQDLAWKAQYSLADTVRWIIESKIKDQV